MKILSIDVGGSHVKVLTNDEREKRSFVSGPSLGPAEMVDGVKRLTHDWAFDVVSLGYPGLVVHGHIASEPHNLGTGWPGFDFERALSRPVKIINDAAMQALGSYEGGRMLFLGLGTGLGSAMIVDGELEPMELSHMPYRKGRTYEDYLGAAGRARLGNHKWEKHVWRVVQMLREALEPDYVVLGGGNVNHLRRRPDEVRLGANANAFTGGFRLWQEHEVLSSRGAESCSLWLIRHGETEWSASGRHTGRTDIPLTDRGEEQARRLGRRLAGCGFSLVLTSPLRRARDTCNLAGYADDAVVDPDLAEWDYGDYEGLTTAEIRTRVPNWDIWSGQVPGGESAAQVRARVDRVIQHALARPGQVALFAHGHLLRALAARWVGLEVSGGRLMSLDAASVSILDHEHEARVISLWNDSSHLI